MVALHPLPYRQSYTLVIKPVESGGFVVTVPTLNAVTEGETYEEAIANAHELVAGYIECLIEDNEVIPVEAHPPLVTNVSVGVNALALAA